MIQKGTHMVLKAESFVAGFLLCMISTLVFISAVARTVGHPINWAQDISLLASAWLTFIGADIVAKTGNLIRIDMLEKHFPKPVRKLLTLVFDVAMLLFLLILIVYGFMLVSQSWYRSFNTLKLSYAWCTLAVPMGSALLLVSIGEKLVRDLTTPAVKWGEEKEC